MCGKPRFHCSLRDYEPLPTFFIDQVNGWATSFTLKVVNKVLGTPGRGPRLSVDVDQTTVTLDGTRYDADVVYVLILLELLKAKGFPITRSAMQTNQATLKLEARLDRKIKDIREGKGLRFRIPIRSSKEKGLKPEEKKGEGYWLPSEYLA